MESGMIATFKHCDDVPYDENFYKTTEKSFYGSWLWAEVNANSLFWKAFYEEVKEDSGEEEIISETLVNSAKVNLFSMTLAALKQRQAT